MRRRPEPGPVSGASVGAAGASAGAAGASAGAAGSRGRVILEFGGGFGYVVAMTGE